MCQGHLTLSIRSLRSARCAMNGLPTVIASGCNSCTCGQEGGAAAPIRKDARPPNYWCIACIRLQLNLRCVSH
jgi:hypothetical protein